MLEVAASRFAAPVLRAAVEDVWVESFKFLLGELALYQRRVLPLLTYTGYTYEHLDSASRVQFWYHP